ncbi:RusA family crossover junction endodeoxyribonuclease [Nocardia cyriacigeorgica]|uniref:RusA family crossover junction endodeoxyribonuclease n=1 Tax=Nocardia cyriacigeorgica TaxID=135487 RepID=UPI00280617CB|nr:RusA family crossover junction endodeoxyribonuclease [Nocardia cyriacigeorgica]
MVTSLRVDGTPRPQGSKNVSRTGHVYESSKHLKAWRASIALAARAHRVRPVNAPVAVGLEFVMPRPARTPKNQPPPPATQRPDLDKLERAVLDALTGIGWVDDSHVTHLIASKRRADDGEPAGVSIHIAPATPADIGHILTTLERNWSPPC